MDESATYDNVQQLIVAGFRSSTRSVLEVVVSESDHVSLAINLFAVKEGHPVVLSVAGSGPF